MCTNTIINVSPALYWLPKADLHFLEIYQKNPIWSESIFYIRPPPPPFQEREEAVEQMHEGNFMG